MKRRLRLFGKIIRVLFLTYIVLYGLTSILFDHQKNGLSDITKEICTTKLIQADTQAALESGIAKEFGITLVYSSGEPTNLKTETVFPYQVISLGEDRYSYRIGASYQNDFGAPTFGVFALDHTISISKPILRSLRVYLGHTSSYKGDVETLEMIIARIEATDYWFIESVRINQHGIWRNYSALRVRCFRGSPVFYVALGKHAMYPSLTSCNGHSIRLFAGIKGSREICNVGELYFPDTSPEFDVGDRQHPVNIFLTSPTLLESGVFTGEDVWGSCFYGGWGNGEGTNSCHGRYTWQ